MLTLSVGLYAAFAADLEEHLDDPILPPASNLYRAYLLPGPVIPVITESSEEATVKAIQEKLVSLGYDTGGIDGIYGPNTRNAVMLFQESRNLIVDGIVGPQTRAALGL
jgi:peptidoglycan hydrolase-like protein with peptidoglycan-binding domain